MDSLFDRTMTRAGVLRLATAVGLSAAGLGVIACGDDSSSGTATGGGDEGPVQRGGTLRIATGGAASAETLVPFTALSTNLILLTSQIWETLTRQTDAFAVEPGLASSWRSNADATEWTFELRRGVVFHDGTPMTSRDVAYSLRQNLDEAVGSALYARLSTSLDPSGIQTPDDHTVVLRLKQPDGVMPLILSERQAKIVKNGAKDFSARNAIGTGPFRLESWTSGQRWSVVRNDTYWREGYPYLDGIQAVVIPELSTRVQSVVSGGNDLTDPIDASAVGSVQGGGGATLLEHKNAYSYAIVMDLRREPFTDPRVVQAVKLAQDRQRILEAALQGYGSVTGDLPVSPENQFYPPSLGVPEQNVEEARRLLADAGYPNGIKLELNTSPIAGGVTDVAVAFQEVVKPAGIDVEIRQAPEATYWDKTWMRVPMFMDFWLSRYPETVLSLFYVSDASWNESHLNSPELDRLTEQARATPDRARQQRLIQEALHIAATQSGVTIPLLGSRLWPHKKTVRGLRPSNTQYLLLEETWLAT